MARPNITGEFNRRIQDFSYHILVDVDIEGVAVPEHRSLFRGLSRQISLKHLETLRGVVIEFQNAVSGAEAHFVGQLVDIYAGALVAYVGLAIVRQDAGIYYDGEDEVEKHSAEHHQEPLPGRLAAEFPRLRLAFQLFRVHGLVYHAGYLAVPAERKPAYAVFGIGIFRLEPEQGETGVEEQVKFFDADTEYLGENEMS